MKHIYPKWHPEHLAKKLPYLRQRQKTIASIRQFFLDQVFDEVETPLLQVTPGLDPHIMGFKTEWQPIGMDAKSLYLHTSPEFAMKKLLVAGLPKIFQITKVFRNEAASTFHSPEFTMIEWYRAHAGYEQLMDDCTGLLQTVANQTGDKIFKAKNLTSDPFQDWQRISVQDAFLKYADIDLHATAPDPKNPDVTLLRAEAKRINIRTDDGDNWDDIFFRIFDDRIEKNLGHPAPTILYEYPASMSALSRIKHDDPRVCERFELYVCGVELANAFGELTDPQIQRQRFIDDMDKKEKIYGFRYPLDEDFLGALEFGMPPSSGIALGIDRLCMLAGRAEHINDVLWMN